MSLLQLSDVCLAFGLKPLLDNVNFVLEPRERVCLLGRNGEGKSSLLKLVNGEQKADSGTVRIAAGVKVGVLPQDVPTAVDKKVYDVVAEGLPEIGDLLSRYHRLVIDHDGNEMLAELERVQEALEAKDGWSFNHKIESLIKRFELNPDQMMSELSGGWRRRVLLAKALLGDPDLLLLDEPTNHLDIPALSWLEKQLHDFQGSLLFVSHDRAFIRSLSTRIIELDRGVLTSWPGNYDKYLEGKEKALEDEARQAELFDKKLSEEEVWIRQGIKARRTRNEGRVRALKALREERKQRRERQGSVDFKVEEADRSGKLIAELKGVGFAYGGESLLFQQVNLTIVRGDKVGLIGQNGVGKSTFLKLLLGQLQPTEGSIKLGTNQQVAYFDQMRAGIDLEKSVMDNVGEGRDFLEINGKSRHVIGYLNDFLFSPERTRTPVKALSGGEKNRLLLAKLFSKPANVLVMDEPTNDLDMDTLDLLEELIANFGGTVLITSHDRVFLDNVVTSTLYFDGAGHVREYVGGYGDWVRQTGGFSVQGSRPVTKEERTEKTQVANKSDELVKPAQSKKLSYKLQRELEQIPVSIDRVEVKIAKLHEETGLPGFYDQDHALVKGKLEELSACEAELEQLMERWVELESM